MKKTNYAQSYTENDVSDLCNDQWAQHVKKTIQYNRERSDIIRENIIPQLVKSHINSKEAFYKIHTEACGDNVELATGFIPTPDPDCDYMSCTGGDIQPGKCRKNFVDTGHAWHVNPEYMVDLEKELFGSIDKLHVVDEIDCMRKLTLIQATLLIAHFPEDISGRTAEDFLVYLSQKYGYPLSISPNGYRGLNEDTRVKKVMDAQQTLYSNILYDYDQKQPISRFSNQKDLHVGYYFESFVGKNFLEPGTYVPYRMTSELPSDKVSRAIQKHIADIAHQFSRLLLQESSKQQATIEAYNGLNELFTNLLEVRNKIYTIFSKQGAEICDSTMALLLISPIAISHVSSNLGRYMRLIKHIATGIRWMQNNNQLDLAEQTLKRSNELFKVKHFLDLD